MTGRPPTDPSQLERFPEVIVDEGETFFRVHRADYYPEYFCNDGDCRFDPPKFSREEYGTCYLSTSQEGAFLETLGRIRPLPEDLVDERALSELRPAHRLRLADLTNPSVIGRFGIDGELSVGQAYELPQLWGGALLAAGFHGIHYTVRHDPAFTERSVALFGEPGEQPNGSIRRTKDGQPDPIDDGLLRHMRNRYGIIVVPAVFLD